MLASHFARTGRIPAAGHGTKTTGRRIEWSDVVRGLSDSRARPVVLVHYSAAGFTPDEFGHLRNAREAMANALTHAEGWLEPLTVRATDGRDTIRDLRRRLEWELWP